MANDLVVINPESSEVIPASSTPLDRNPAAVYLAGLSPTGRRAQLQALNIIAGMLSGGKVSDCLAVDWTRVRYQHAAAIRARLLESYKPATANRILSGLRGVLREAWKLELISAEDYYRAKSVKGIRGSTLLAGRALAPGELAALMANCENDSSPAGVRDGAIIALMYGAGLRLAEVPALDLKSFEPDSGHLVITGKGNKQRTNYAINGADDAMADWLELRGGDPGALFWPINKSGALAARRLTPQSIYYMLARRAKSAGVKKFTPHDLRRSWASDLLDAGVDISTVAKMAGHESVNTTLRYDRRKEVAKQKAAGMLHIPYHRRRSAK
jgi:integrase/recombinase XerD